MDEQPSTRIETKTDLQQQPDAGSAKHTRWERIVQRHVHKFSVDEPQSNEVKRLFRLDYVNKHQQRNMQLTDASAAGLDPTLLMDMRHAAVARVTPKSGNTNPQHAVTTAAAMCNVQRGRLLEHNSKVEQHRHEHELRQFKKTIGITKPTVRHMQEPQPTPALVVKLDNYRTFAGDEDVNLFSPPLTTTRSNFEILENANNYNENQLNNIEPFEGKQSTNKTSEEFKEVHNMHVDEHSTDDEDTNMLRYLSNELRGERHQSLQVLGTPLNIRVSPPDHDHEDEYRRFAGSITVIKSAVRNIEMSDGTNNENGTVTPLPHSEIIAEVLRNNTNETDRNRDDIKLLQIYFKRWTHYVTFSKLTFSRSEPRRAESRAAQINQYLSAIRLEKNAHKSKEHSYAEDEKTRNIKRNSEISGFATGMMIKKFSNKLKVQKDIIELQRLKLERQQRLIAELKYTRLAEETLDSQAACRQELDTQRRIGCARTKQAARSLQTMAGGPNADDDGNCGGVLDEYERLQARGTPKFLQDMQARALQRNVRHREACERRERREREVEAQRLAAEAAKLLQDEQAKQQRIEELRAKRRAERQQREQRERDRLRYMENVHLANQFNRRRLLRRYGLDAFRALLHRKRRNLHKAETFCVYAQLRRSFAGWLAVVRQADAERDSLATSCARRQRLRHAMVQWKMIHAVQTAKIRVAIDWHAMRLTERALRHWNAWWRRQRCVDELRSAQANAHYEWHLKWRVLDRWRRLPQILQLERETDIRRQRWRVKVWELLPDYRPHANDD